MIGKKKKKKSTEFLNFSSDSHKSGLNCHNNTAACQFKRLVEAVFFSPVNTDL